MSGTRTRLRLIEGRLPRRPAPPPSSFDPARLGPREQGELDELLALATPRPGARWDWSALSDEQLERTSDLVNKGHGIAASPAYYGMPHRPPGIGECRCVDCERKAKGA